MSIDEIAVPAEPISAATRGELAALRPGHLPVARADRLPHKDLPIKLFAALWAQSTSLGPRCAV
jgi:hypothetical protein